MQVEEVLAPRGHPSVLHLEHDAAVGVERSALADTAVVVQADDTAVLAVEHRQEVGLERPLGLAAVATERGEHGVAATGDYERDMARFQHVSLAALVVAMVVLATSARTR